MMLSRVIKSAAKQNVFASKTILSSLKTVGIQQLQYRQASFTFNKNVSLNQKRSTLVSNRFASVQAKKSFSIASYPGEKSQFTLDMKFVNGDSSIPTYRIMDENGVILDKKQDPQLSKDTVRRMYECMIILNSMDNVLYDVQRQGRVSFYMTNYGEEATHIGSAAALDPQDTIFGQYREAGVLMWRGFTLDEFMNQCYSNTLDYGKGRQMPVHYGSNKINFQTISSPLATQIPQASGSGYAQKLLGLKNCTMCYFGEGAASEGDFHAAINFAATLETQTIFFCRNNRWAISTPSKEQYKGDGIAGRGPAYGIHTIRVDGNDVFAVYNATKAARDLAVNQSKPVLIEAMTYRLGHHSTSDDATRYRQGAEVDQWRNSFHPSLRLKKYLMSKGWWTEEEDKQLIQTSKANVLEALKKAEGQKKPSIEELFTDVYDSVPPHLQEQRAQLLEHLKKYPEFYPIDQHEGELPRQ